MQTKKSYKEMTAEEKQLEINRIDELHATNELDLDNVAGDVAFLLEHIAHTSKAFPVVSAARGLMIDLGRGNRDVSMALAEIHNSLRALDGKDYLAHKSQIIT